MEEDYLEKLQIKYLGVYLELPVEAPIGCPHIIDVNSMDDDSYDLQSMTIADAVVTILYKYMPCALTAFLDLDRPNFHYIQAGNPGTRLDFCIKRDERMVGFLNEKELGGWDNQQNYFIDDEATSKWTPISFRVGKKKPITDKDTLLGEASSHVYSILIHEPWSADLPGASVEIFTGLSSGRVF